jgi:hypothetical protein
MMTAQPYALEAALDFRGANLVGLKCDGRPLSRKHSRHRRPITLTRGQAQGNRLERTGKLESGVGGLVSEPSLLIVRCYNAGRFGIASVSSEAPVAGVDWRPTASQVFRENAERRESSRCHKGQSMPSDCGYEIGGIDDMTR